MATDSRISSALGVPLPQWIIDQLDRRSKELGAISRDTDNIRFQGNRTAWVRMVSSVDVVKESSLDYFRKMGLGITDKSSLSKLFVLQGGVTTYEGNNLNLPNYKQRGGFSESYNVAGPNEILNYGYRPMPGITSVKVQTQGKLGSVRSADIQLKVWDKAQLDIIDALYLKLGFTMFLEWGHTYYYDNNGVLQSSDQYSIDPFAPGLTKEDIGNQISNNINKSKGNYDAMLGIVTNFNFTYNQEGGYDCTIKLMALGSLISSMKMNNPRILPDLSESIIQALVNTLIKEEERRQQLLNQKNEVATETTTTTTTIKPLSLNDFFEEKIKASNPQDSLRDYLYLPTQAPGAKISDASKSDVIYDPENLWGIRKFGVVLSAENATNQISSVTLSANSIKQNLPLTYVDDGGWFSKDKTYKVSTADDFAKIPAMTEDTLPDTTGFVEYAKRAVLGQNFDLFELNYYRDDNQEVYTGGELQTIKLKRNYKLYIFISRASLKGTTGVLGGWDREPTELEQQQIKKAVFNQILNENISVSQSGGKITMSLEKVSFSLDPFRRGQSEKSLESNPYTNRINVFQTTKYRPNLFLYNNLQTDIPIDPSKKDSAGATTKKVLIEYVVGITDSGLIQDIKLNDGTNTNILEFLNYQKKLTDQNKVEIPKVVTPEPALKASDIQTSEALKYQSAFEVMMRTLQLYSLDQAIKSQIDVDKKVRTLDLTQPGDGGVYKTFTKNLFSVGIFSNIMDDLVTENYPLEQLCKTYDEQIQANGIMQDKDAMFKLRAFFGFHFGLMGNNVLATELYKEKCAVNYKELLRTYIVPYEFNSGVFEGTQVNHPVYVPLGLVIMVLNHVCGIYDSNGKATFSTPLVYVDYNPVSNLCMSNAKQLSTNPYDILIPFQGDTTDYESILDPTVLQKGKNGNLEIKPASGSVDPTPLFNIRDKDNGDKISAGLLQFKTTTSDSVETYRGRTMNVLISIDYLLKVVSSYSKNNGSGDIYFKEFIEQILFDVNKYLGDINLFRLAYNDAANTSHIVDDQFIPNLEGRYTETNKSMLPLFGSGSIARSVEIRTDMSNKLNNMLAISANSNLKDQSTLSKNGDSVGFYNLSYTDRYIPFRGEFTSSITLPTNTMINSAIQFNKAIETFYSEAKPAESSVSHATGYYIERMAKIKGEEKGTRASAMIPVSLNFSMDGISGLGMGHAFTIPEQFLPYTYDLSLSNPLGKKDEQNTVGFVMIGLDQTIEGNQWISSVRANMIYLKKRQDFETTELRGLSASTLGLNLSESGEVTVGPTYLPSKVKNSSNFQKFISQPGVKEKVESIAAELGVKPDDLYIIFKAETAGTFDSTIKNSIGAVGLIQFIPSTAKSLGTTTEALQKMSTLEQLDYVRKYFIGRKGQYKNAYDLYMQTFFPLAIGKPADFVIQTSKQSATLISKQNPAIAKAAGKNPGDPLTVADFYKYVSSLLV